MLRKVLILLSDKDKLINFINKVVFSKEISAIIAMGMIVMALVLLLVVLCIKKEGLDLDYIFSLGSSKERNLLIESFDNK